MKDREPSRGKDVLFKVAEGIHRGSRWYVDKLANLREQGVHSPSTMTPRRTANTLIEGFASGLGFGDLTAEGVKFVSGKLKDKLGDSD